MCIKVVVCETPLVKNYLEWNCILNWKHSYCSKTTYIDTCTSIEHIQYVLTQHTVVDVVWIHINEVLHYISNAAVNACHLIGLNPSNGFACYKFACLVDR